MNDVKLSRYMNEHGGKMERLLWEIVWRLFAATTPRWMSNGLRRALLRGFGATVGKDVRIHGHSHVWLPQNLVIGDHSWIGGEANLYNVAAIRIGDNAVISEEAFLCTAGHDIASDRFALTTAPIEVGDMAWIGARAIVLPGRKIGTGAVVAAGAVVTHDVEPWTVVAGNPARVVKRREIRPSERPKEHRGGLRILHIASGLLNTGGGVSECVPEACRELNAIGHDVGLVVCERGELSKSAILAEREGVTIYRFYGAPFKWNPICFTWRMWRGLERVMREYDVVHINGVWLFPTWWAAHVARKLGKPYVLRPHGSFMPDRLLISRWKKVPAGFLFDRPVVRRASAVLATCQEEEDAIRAYEPTAKAMTLPYVIDLSGAEKFQSFKVEKFQGCKVGGE
ncbi:MAG: glycosyltransferase, partial [bacterium]|nr:glycosyltransferase [Candidatus Colisoma equi]